MELLVAVAGALALGERLAEPAGEAAGSVDGVGEVAGEGGGERGVLLADGVVDVGDGQGLVAEGGVPVLEECLPLAGLLVGVVVELFEVGEEVAGAGVVEDAADGARPGFEAADGGRLWVGATGVVPGTREGEQGGEEVGAAVASPREQRVVSEASRCQGRAVLASRRMR